MKKKFLAYILLLILALSACGHTTENSIRPAKKVGTVILSVNPAVEVEYDENGLVMDVIGLNEDGLELAANKEDLLGIPCLIALHTLIVQINDAGFFISDFGGEGREIILLLEKGSIYHKGFLKALEESIYDAAEDCGLKAINLTTINENIEDTEITEDMELHQLYLPAEQTE